MAVLTISREIGSGGPYIGQKTAERLGYHYVDKKMLNEVFRQYGFISFEKIYESPTSFWDKFDNMRTLTVQNLNAVIEALAAHGDVVLLGRGGFAVLSGLVDVINVRLQAAFPIRVSRFMEMEGLKDQKEAERILVEKGNVRSSFVESTYQVPWDAASNFDLVIDTGKVSPDMTVDFLCQAVNSLEKPATGDFPTAAGLTVENFMAGAVRGALDCSQTHW